MRNLPTVEKFKALNDLIVQKCGFLFLEALLAHDVVEKFASLGILHDHIDRLLIFNDIVQLNDVLVLDFLEYFDFAANPSVVRHLGYFLTTEYLDSDLLSCLNVDSKFYFSKGALAQVAFESELSYLFLSRSR